MTRLQQFGAFIGDIDFSKVVAGSFQRDSVTSNQRESIKNDRASEIDYSAIIVQPKKSQGKDISPNMSVDYSINKFNSASVNNPHNQSMSKLNYIINIQLVLFLT
jgi:hypothetical protein